MMEQGRVHKFLEELSKTPGVIGCSLIDKQGRVIDRVCPYRREVSDDDLAAIVTTMYSATEMVSSEMKLGDASLISVEFPHNYFFVVNLGARFLLSVVAEKGSAVTLGRVRLEIGKTTKKINDLFSSEGEIEEGTDQDSGFSAQDQGGL